MKKILYIEDNQDTADAVRMMLNNNGFKAETKSNGKDGIEEAKNNNYDLILLDIMLPDMSGWDIFENLQRAKLNAKFAFLSAIPISLERMKELKKSGISDYITKPFTKQDLINRIKNILE